MGLNVGGGHNLQNNGLVDKGNAFDASTSACCAFLPQNGVD
jgi:hypothetical protein